MNTSRRLYVYVDVDDTLLRSAGTKRMPIPTVVSHVKELASTGAELYCWSTVGAEYARLAARELGVESCFVAFLPKPNILIDDQEVAVWKRLKVIHPLNVSGQTVEIYLSMLDGSPEQK
jgi:hypothetical protein